MHAALTVDLNADLGESVDGVATADDAAMFDLISSANIACGGHAGDERSLAEAIARATRKHVAIGAHPSYPDREGFGRRPWTGTATELERALAYQLRMFADTGVRYVKPHGALYNTVVHDGEHARALVAATLSFSDQLGREVGLLVLGGEIERQARAAGITVVREAFLDRGYAADGTLVPRSHPAALLHDAALVADRAIRLVTEGVVEAVDGTVVPVSAESLCVHGDTPSAVAMAVAVRAALAEAGVSVESPWLL